MNTHSHFQISLAMLSLSRFSEFQENGHVATCEVDGKVKYCMPSETDATISRLIPFVSSVQPTAGNYI